MIERRTDPIERVLRLGHTFAVFPLKDGHCGVHIWEGDDQNPKRYAKCRALHDALDAAVREYHESDLREPLHKDVWPLDETTSLICGQLQDWLRSLHFFYATRDENGEVIFELRRAHFVRERNVVFRSQSGMFTEYSCLLAPGNRWKYREQRMVRTGRGQDFWSAAAASFVAPEVNFAG